MKNITSFAIIGSGWRGSHFLRIARELPEYFSAEGILVRDEEKARSMERQWGVRTFQNLDEMLSQCNVSFVILAVPADVSCDYIIKLSNAGMPVLAETPPGVNREEFCKLGDLIRQKAKVQVAEQYPFQPLLAAQLAVAHSGKLGKISFAHVSVAHSHHAICLIRKLLSSGFESVSIHGEAIPGQTWSGPSRTALPIKQEVHPTNHIFSRLKFGNKVGICDFDGGQYAGGWIRAQRIYIRGERGELSGNTVRYMKDYCTPVELHLVRKDAGVEASTKEGFGHKMYLLGEDVVSRSPFRPAKLNDDELAIAICMDKMTSYINGGPSFYGLDEAIWDRHLSNMMDSAIENSKEVSVDNLPLS